MATARVSLPRSAGSAGSDGPVTPGLDLEDYSLYSNLSDDELIQLAIERSLTENQGSAPPAEHLTGSPRAPHPPAANYNSQNPPAAHFSSQNPPAAHSSSQNPPAAHSSSQNPPAAHSSSQNPPHEALKWIRCERVEKEEPLFEAIKSGDASRVKALAGLTSTNLMMPSKPGWLALHQAAFYGQEACLRVLLAAKPGMINKKTGKDQTALLIAVSRDHVGCATALLQDGADPDLMNKDGETPLYKACERDNPEMVALLLNHGAAVNMHCVLGWTALQEAVCRNNIEICEMLVRAGAKLSLANNYGIMPLFTAAQSGQLEALRFLLKHGADINSQATDGATALYEATKNGHVEIVEFLLSQNADANKPGKTGLLPLHIAAQRGTDIIVSLLIPATSKARVRRSGISPLHLAAEHNRDEVLEVLIEAGFDINAKLSEQRSMMYEDRRSTALYFAVFNNNIEAARMLLEAGADPNLDIFNPLLVAVRQGCIETVTLLVEHGANVNAYIPTYPATFPATMMFCMKYLSMLKYLLDNGCDALSCFTCRYGSGPHPPVKSSRSGRQDLRYTERGLIESTGDSIQFCDVISTPSICRWAGPIIDVLLDYVGHVKLCSRLLEHLESYPDWHDIKDKAAPPRSLMQLCRLKIHQLLGVQRLKHLHTLPLPGGLIRFLQHNEGSVDLC
uniref:Ankyrin repeat and SOCS box containing 2 n=1 Tax=Myripristis murdjan TaxID=586833 RepID=A0A667XGJ0_9TELE